MEDIEPRKQLLVKVYSQLQNYPYDTLEHSREWRALLSYTQQPLGPVVTFFDSRGVYERFPPVGGNNE